MTLDKKVEGDPKAYDSTGLWSLEIHEVGRPLPSNKLRTFLYYLCSRGTRWASIKPYKSDEPSIDPSAAVEVMLTGPRADDGEYLSTSYRLRREEIHGDGVLHEGLAGWEKRLLLERIKHLSPTRNDLWQPAIKALSEVLKPP